MKYIFIILGIISVLILSGCTIKNRENNVCTMDAKLCLDGSSVGRDANNNCKFPACPESKLKANECNASPRVKNCPDVYTPVCGWFNQSINCIKYPCMANYGNACWACSQEKVDYWTEGPCPRNNAEMQSECKDAGGNWLSESKECEGITQEQCTIMNGEFNECASACRNNPNAQACTLQCVQVCQFKK